MIEYVAGFMFSNDFKRVALIRKQKPDWQRGLLNGIGGKIDPGETEMAAMHREFLEEAGVAMLYWEWSPFARLFGPWFSVSFFSTTGPVDDLVSQEEEKVEIIAVDSIKLVDERMIENLPWLIALAIDNMKDGRPHFVQASYITSIEPKKEI